MTAASFIAFLAVFLAIGIASARRAQGTRKDYYLASQSVSPALVGLSAVATNNSGYMFIGVIGYTYATGLPAIWLMLGWILGDFLASMFIHRKITMRHLDDRHLELRGAPEPVAGHQFRGLLPGRLDHLDHLPRLPIRRRSSRPAARRCTCCSAGPRRPARSSAA